MKPYAARTQVLLWVPGKYISRDLWTRGPHMTSARSKPVFLQGDSSGSNLFQPTPKRGSWSRDLFPNYELLDLATMALPIMVDTAVRTDCLARQGSYFHLKGTVKACQNSGGKVFRKQLLRSFF